MNSPLSVFYKDKGEVAYYINKQYTSILMNCENDGWPVCMPTDEVRLCDGVGDSGRYYIESTGGFALQGNGWHCDSGSDKALNYKLIASEDIKYQLKASMSLKPNHFKQFVLEVYDKFECLKQSMGLWDYCGNPI